MFRRTYILLLFLIILSCTHRDKINLFDPENSVNIEQFLYLTTKMKSSGFEVYCNLYKQIQFDSVFIYKSVGDSLHFQKIYAADSTPIQFLDSSISPSTPIFYSASLYADGIETNKIYPQKRIFSRTNFLVFSIYGYALYQYTFDFEEENNVFYLPFPSFFWYYDSLTQNTFLSSYSYDAISKLNIKDGSLDVITTLKNPGPILLYNEFLFIASIDSPAIITKCTVNGEKLDSIMIPDGEILSLIPYIPNKILAVFSNKIVELDNNLQLIDSLLSPQAEVSGAIYQNNYLYVLIHENSQSRIVQYNSLNDANGTTIVSGNLGSAFTVYADTLYYEERSKNSSTLVKQIINGNRLFSISDFNDIFKIAPIPNDNVVVVLDRFFGNIYLVSNKGDLLLRKTLSYDPVDIVKYHD